MSEAIALNIRTLREARGWTQEQLATIARVTPRTIQRAEKTGIVNQETLRDLAAAFKVEPEFLKIDTKALAAEAEEFLQRHTIVEMSEFTERMTLPKLEGVCAMHFKCAATTPNVAEPAAEINDWLQELLDCADLMSASQWLETSKALYEVVKKLHAADATLSLGIGHVDVVGMGKSSAWPVLVALVNQGGTAPTHAAIERTLQVG